MIGASAGGVEALRTIVADLPPDLSAAICVVLHIDPASPSALSSILQRAGRLTCRSARDGEDLAAGQILVAPPDRHLVVEDGRVRLTIGPRENNHRPAVDALFRSAAHERGTDVIGVVLSGNRDDGTVGLAMIKAHGGATIVQDPADAAYPGMPTSAIEHVAVDAVVPSAELGRTIAAMVNGEHLPDDTDPGNPVSDGAEAGGLTLICPECGGVLSEHTEAGVNQWGCRVGHRYSPEALADAQAEDIEAGPWTAVRALSHRSRLLNRMANRADARGAARSARRFRRRAQQADEQAELVRGVISRAAQTALRKLADDDEERIDEGHVA